MKYSTTQFLRPESILLLDSFSERNQLNDLECLNTIHFCVYYSWSTTQNTLTHVSWGKRKGTRDDVITNRDWNYCLGNAIFRF